MKTVFRIMVILAFFYLFNLYDKYNDNLDKNPSPKRKAIDNISFSFEWSKAGFENIMEATFKLNNQNSFDIKDITVSCVHFASSGTLIDKNERTIYEIIPAKSEITFEKFNMGFIHSQVASSSCSIIDLKMK